MKNNIIENDKILFTTDFKEDYSKNSKFCNDFKATFIRRLYLIIRDLKSFLMEILCPIILVIIGLCISRVNINWSSDPWHINISYIGQQRVLFSSIEGIENIREYYFNEKYVNVTCQTLSIEKLSQNEKDKAIVNCIDRIYETNKDTEDSKLKEVDMTDENYFVYFGWYHKYK